MDISKLYKGGMAGGRIPEGGGVSLRLLSFKSALDWDQFPPQKFDTQTSRKVLFGVLGELRNFT